VPYRETRPHQQLDDQEDRVDPLCPGRRLVKGHEGGAVRGTLECYRIALSNLLRQTTRAGRSAGRAPSRPRISPDALSAPQPRSYLTSALRLCPGRWQPHRRRLCRGPPPPPPLCHSLQLEQAPERPFFFRQPRHPLVPMARVGIYLGAEVISIKPGLKVILSPYTISRCRQQGPVRRAACRCSQTSMSRQLQYPTRTRSRAAPRVIRDSGL